MLLWALKQLTPVGYESQNWVRVNYNCNKADNKSFHWGVVQANQPSLDELECDLNDLFQPGGVSVCRSILFHSVCLACNLFGILTARIWRSLQPKAVQISQAPDWEALGMTWPLIRAIWLWCERDERHELETKFCWPCSFLRAGCNVCRGLDRRNSLLIKLSLKIGSAWFCHHAIEASEPCTSSNTRQSGVQGYAENLGRFVP